MVASAFFAHQATRFRDWINPPLHGTALDILSMEQIDNFLRRESISVLVAADQSLEARIAKITGDALELELDLIHRGLGIHEKINAHVESGCVALRFADGSECKLDVLAHESLRAHSSLPAALQKLPELCTRLGELIFGALVPLAHFLSNAATSKKIDNILALVVSISRERRNAQRVRLNTVWIRVVETVQHERAREARRQLSGRLDELLEFRLMGINDMYLCVRHDPWAEASFFGLSQKKGTLYAQSIRVECDLVWDVYLALVLDYLVRVAIGRTDGFLAFCLPAERARLDELLKIFADRERQFAFDYPSAALLMKEGASVVSAYRQFLSCLEQKQTPASPNQARANRLPLD